MPGIVDLKSNLKNLKFGKDRRGGGDSGQPYIQTPIPDSDDSLLNFDEGLIRGGVLQAAKSATLDTLRIAKYFIDPPKGPLFLAKQVGLQLSNPRIETNPFPTANIPGMVGDILNAGANLLNSAQIGPTRLYNLGINTLAQVPAGMIGTHFNRHGLLPVQDDSSKYYSVVKNKSSSDNRLVQLRKKLLLTDTEVTLNNKESNLLGSLLATTALGDLTSGTNAANFLKSKQLSQQSIIDSYIGGPGSVYGIGTTNIRRTEYTPSFSDVASKYFDAIRKQNSENVIQTNRLLNITSTLAVSSSNNPRTSNTPVIDTVTPPTSPVIVSHLNYNTQQTLLRGDSKKFYIDTRVNRGSPGDLTRDRSNYNNGEALDKITALPIFQAGSPNEVKGQSGTDPLRDLIKFRFEAIETDNPVKSNFIVFRAFVKDISQPWNPVWNGIQYNGRGEQFYIYNGFTTSVSFTFTLAAQSRAEMKPMYQKLNYLISNLTPDYKANRMRGPLMKLTIGNFIYRQPGFIANLNTNISNDTPWEIALDEPEGGRDDLMLELPHVIDVQCTFVPIYNFLPQKSINKSPFIADKGNEGKQGERWIIDTKLKDNTLNKNIN